MELIYTFAIIGAAWLICYLLQIVYYSILLAKIRRRR